MFHSTIQDGAFLEVADVKGITPSQNSKLNRIHIFESKDKEKLFPDLVKVVNQHVQKSFDRAAKGSIAKNPRSKSSTHNGTHSNAGLKTGKKLSIINHIDTVINGQAITLGPLKQNSAKKTNENQFSPYSFNTNKNNLMEPERSEPNQRGYYNMSPELVVKKGYPKSHAAINFYSFNEDPYESLRKESSLCKQRDDTNSRPASLDMEKAFRSLFQPTSKLKIKENSHDTTTLSNSTITTRATLKNCTDTGSLESKRAIRGHSQDSSLKLKQKLFKKSDPYSLELNTGNSDKISRLEFSIERDNTLTPVHKPKKQNIFAGCILPLAKKNSSSNLYNDLNKSIEIRGIKLQHSVKFSPEKSPMKSSAKQHLILLNPLNNLKFAEAYGSLANIDSQQQPQVLTQQIHLPRLVKQLPYSEHDDRFSTITRHGHLMTFSSTLEVKSGYPCTAAEEDTISIEEQLEFERNSSIRSAASSIWRDKETNLGDECSQHLEEKNGDLYTIRRTINGLLHIPRQIENRDQSYTDYSRRGRSKQCEIDYSLEREKNFCPKSNLPLRAGEQQKKKNYEEHLNQMVNKLRPFSPPFSSVLPLLGNPITENDLGQISTANTLNGKIEIEKSNETVDKTGAGGSQEQELLEVIYDPLLKCYYDQKNNSYYELKVD